MAENNKSIMGEHGISKSQRLGQALGAVIGGMVASKKGIDPIAATVMGFAEGEKQFGKQDKDRRDEDARQRTLGRQEAAPLTTFAGGVEGDPTQRQQQGVFYDPATGGRTTEPMGAPYKSEQALNRGNMNYQRAGQRWDRLILNSKNNAVKQVVAQVKSDDSRVKQLKEQMWLAPESEQPRIIAQIEGLTGQRDLAARVREVAHQNIIDSAKHDKSFSPFFSSYMKDYGAEMSGKQQKAEASSKAYESEVFDPISKIAGGLTEGGGKKATYVYDPTTGEME